MVTEHRHHTQHFMTMDGLRGIAALIVCFYHRRWWLGEDVQFHGSLAVDFFFLLSGFVIAQAYSAKLTDGRMSFGAFVRVRVIRLYPLIALGAVLGTTAFIIEAIQSQWLGLAVRSLAALPFALLALPQPFLKEPFLPNSPVWSLFFEIIANLLYAALVPRLSTRWVVALVVALGVSLAITIGFHGTVNFGWLWPDMWLGLFRVGFPFTLGVLLQRLHRSGNLNIPGFPVWVLAPILAASLFVPTLKSFEMSFNLIAIFVIFPIIVACAANDQPTPYWTKLSRLSANLSYPLYMLHLPVFNLLERVSAFTALPAVPRYGIALATCIIAALIAGKFYDQQVRTWLGNRFKIYNKK